MTVQAALRGLKNAAEWLGANRDAAADIVAKDINIPKPIVLGTFAKTFNQVTMSAEWAREFDEEGAIPRFAEGAEAGHHGEDVSSRTAEAGLPGLR